LTSGASGRRQIFQAGPVRFCFEGSAKPARARQKIRACPDVFDIEWNFELTVPKILASRGQKFYLATHG
jgi:hypothetical protein